MKKDRTALICLIDRSGSMESCRQDLIGGFNNFIEEQKKQPGELLLTLVQFDNWYEIVYNYVPVEEIKPFTLDTFVPRGSTALLDAIAKLIDDTGEKFANLPEEERPEKVLFVIYTDGQENSSREQTYMKVEERITHQREKYNWQFIFLGANQDAIATACQLGINVNTSLTYKTIHTSDSYKSLGKLVSAFRATDFTDKAALDKTGFDEDDKKNQN